VCSSDLIVRRNPIDETAVLALFRERLAKFKHPRRVVFLDALPRNAMGKVQKFELKRLLETR
jgi:acyl-coenzyme A synthetase/AMP-(fatty) acid ligase